MNNKNVSINITTIYPSGSYDIGLLFNLTIICPNGTLYYRGSDGWTGMIPFYNKTQLNPGKQMNFISSVDIRNCIYYFPEWFTESGIYTIKIIMEEQFVSNNLSFSL